MAPPDRLRAFTEEMDAADVDWQLIVYGGAEHAFHLPPMNEDGSLSGEDAHEHVVPGVGYHHLHARRSWRAILDLLDEAFLPGSGYGRTA
jgi:dienelactone hydrolase